MPKEQHHDQSLVIGGIAAAAVIAGTTGAVALASPSSPPTPKPTASSSTAVDPNVALSGTGGPGSSAKAATPLPPDAGLNALAARLHVSTARAAQVFDALDRMDNPGHGIVPARPEFAALAHSLGQTPAQLAQILRDWKESLRGTMPQSSSPQPATPSTAAS